MLLWIDDQEGADIRTMDGIYTDFPAYTVYVGKDFNGVIRSLALSHNIDWDCQNEGTCVSSHITSNRDYISSLKSQTLGVDNLCSSYGSTTNCSFCSSL